MKDYEFSQNSVSAVFFPTREGKKNGNDPKAPMGPEFPVFLIRLTVISKERFMEGTPYDEL
jgi:hypothetical protein